MYTLCLQRSLRRAILRLHTSLDRILQYNVEDRDSDTIWVLLHSLRSDEKWLTATTTMTTTKRGWTYEVPCILDNRDRGHAVASERVADPLARLQRSNNAKSSMKLYVAGGATGTYTISGRWPKTQCTCTREHIAAMTCPARTWSSCV